MGCDNLFNYNISRFSNVYRPLQTSSRDATGRTDGSWKDDVVIENREEREIKDEKKIINGSFGSSNDGGICRM